MPSGILNKTLEFLFRRGGVGQGVGAQQYPELLFDLPHCLEMAGRVVSGEDLFEAVAAVSVSVSPPRKSSIRWAQASRCRGRGGP